MKTVAEKLMKEIYWTLGVYKNDRFLAKNLFGSQINFLVVTKTPSPSCELLCSMGDRFTKEQCDMLFKDAPTDDNGMLNYAEFTKILKHGTKDKDNE